MTFSADDLDESNARQIDAKRFFPQENYRVLSRTRSQIGSSRD